MFFSFAGLADKRLCSLQAGPDREGAPGGERGGVGGVQVLTERRPHQRSHQQALSD